MNLQRSLEEFLEKNRISKESWEKASIDWISLLKIGMDHTSHLSHLEASATLIASVIQKFDKVHSVRWRVKDADHLMEKIIRKRAEGIEKYLTISLDNYHEVVTDLVGIRALHLFKSDFQILNQSILTSFNHLENATAYVRNGDNELILNSYKEAGLETKVHLKGYRSIHYIIKTQPLKNAVFAELQVRTIFEEGWSEIDHTIRYPNFSNDPQVAYLLTIFNRMAGNADEVGDYIKNLETVLSALNEKIELANKETEDALNKLEAALNKFSEKNQDTASNQEVSEAREAIKNLHSNVTNPSQVMASNQLDFKKYVHRFNLEKKDPLQTAIEKEKFSKILALQKAGITYSALEEALKRLNKGYE